MTNYAQLPDGSLDRLLGSPLKTTNPAGNPDGAVKVQQGAKMTNSAPHDGQRPPLSEEKSVRMHETKEHLRPRAPGASPSETLGQDETGTDGNRTVSAPVHAPPRLRDTPASILRNALTITTGGLALAEHDTTTREFPLRVEDVAAIDRLMRQALRLLEAEQVVARPDPELVDQLREMERTTRELQDVRDGFHEVAAVGREIL